MPRDEAGERGVAAWLRRWWRALLAELLATALLVWLGLASLMPLKGKPVLLAHPAMAFGFVVIANVVAFGPASGAHMNPAVTLAAVLYSQLGVVPAVGYVLAQMLGATMGFGAVLATTPAAALESAALVAGCTAPAEHVSALGAVLIEAVMTGVLALTCCGVWTTPGPDPAAPIKLGLVVAGLVYAGGHATGASINPARSFAPALLYGHWDYQWVYWVGPLGGAALATLLHRFVLTARPPAPAQHDPAQLPLNEKQDQV